MTKPHGFHEGELEVQRRAGVGQAASRLEGMLAPGSLHRGLLQFLAEQTVAVLTARDDRGRLWVSPLSGPRGFLSAAAPTTLTVGARPWPGDPLHDVAAGQSVGLLVVDLAARRRVRVNGTLVRVDDHGLHVEVDQAYGNCPRYITPRALVPAVAPTVADPGVRRADRIDPVTAELIRAADTLFIGSTHPSRGTDASHRGGPAGFVQVDDPTHLSWPDYAGNDMFNTLGNVAVDPTTAILVPDFDLGRTVHLSGTAAIEWDVSQADGTAADGTGRRVRFTALEVVTGLLLPTHLAGHAAA